MVTKPYGSTGRMSEFITGRISHPKGLAIAAGAAIPTYATAKYLQKRKKK